MQTNVKRQVIATLLRAKRPDLANAVAHTTVAKYQAKGPLEKMIGEISLQETGEWLEESSMKAIVKELASRGITAEDLDEDAAYDDITEVTIKYAAKEMEATGGPAQDAQAYARDVVDAIIKLRGVKKGDRVYKETSNDVFKELSEPAISRFYSKAFDQGMRPEQAAKVIQNMIWDR